MANSWNGIRIKKPKVTNDLGKFITDREHAASRAITAALVTGGAEASGLTPIETGTLINSQFRHVGKDEAGRIVGTVGYTADYAVPVNDPAHPQNFRRPTAEKDFLRKGFDNARSQIDAILTGALKV